MGLKMLQWKMAAYFRDETGAITIDWVVLTGFLVGLGLSLTAAIGPSLITEGEDIVDRASIVTNF